MANANNFYSHRTSLREPSVNFDTYTREYVGNLLVFFFPQSTYLCTW